MMPGRGRPAPQRGRGGGVLRLLLTAAVINALLLLPAWLRGGTSGPVWLAVEALLLTGLFALLPRRRWSAVLAVLAAVLTVASVLVGLGEVAIHRSFARPLNLYLDVHLLASVHDLLAGSIGPAFAWFAAVLAVAVALLAVIAVAWLLRGVRFTGSRSGTTLAAAALLTFGIAGILAQNRGFGTAQVATPAIDLGIHQGQVALTTRRESLRFAAELQDGAERARQLPGLADTDVIVAFVESYGMSAITNPDYAPLIEPRLDALAESVAAAGLHMATGALAAPVRGGQSWLAHGTLLSGMWLDSQLRYELLLASDRPTLIDDFRRTGHDTVAVMPAITRAWPEGRRLGYDRIYAERDIDYAGPHLNWVTMPDQFTWSFFERAVRPPGEHTPVFAEIALISSHAPWTPILPVLDDWETIDDGAVFERWADAGVPPGELWRDSARVREHFARAVAYALEVATAYTERFVDEHTLLILLGDHQPAPLLTGAGASAMVPIHVISGDPALLRPFLARGFRAGSRPPADEGGFRMDEFRGWLLDAFGDG